MSNVSNDLISRSALLKVINSYIFDSTNLDTRRGERLARAHICELIEKAPTAYDVDKVVEQMEKQKGCYFEYGRSALYTAIEIIKAGGINGT